MKRWTAPLCAFAVCVPVVVHATEPPPLIVHRAPTDAPAQVIAARDALEQLARRRATALVDLSPSRPAEARASDSLRLAVEAYQDFRYEQALALLDRGIAAATATGAAGLSPAELSDLFIYRALVHSQRGDTARAWEDFTVAATLAPTRRLDPVRFSPRVIESFQRAVDAVSAQEPIDVTVEAPAACTVIVDGRPLTDSRSVPLRRGEHFARAECPEHQPFAARFAVDVGANTLRPRLQPVPRPDRDRALREARRRGASTMIWSVATGDPEPTVTLHLIDVATGKERSRVFARLDDRGGTAALIAAADKLIDQVVAPQPPLVVTEQPKWYENRWLWGAAGVAIGAAILLPLAIDSNPPAGFDLQIDYPR